MMDSDTVPIEPSKKMKMEVDEGADDPKEEASFSGKSSMITIKLDLQDHTGENHKEYTGDFSIEASVNELKDIVQSLWAIPKINQRLFYNKQCICHRFLKEIGLKEQDVIIVKHSGLDWWQNYRQLAELVLEKPSEREENATQCISYHQLLLESHFYYAYPKFNLERLGWHSEVAAYTDGNFKIMEKAVDDHFFIRHVLNGGTSRHDFVCKCEPRPAEMKGTRYGVIANVQLHGEDSATKYSVKCHHYRTHSRQLKGSSPDIKEVFIYKLLELLEVGPAMQFILPSGAVGTKTAIYIATKWRDDFTDFDKVEKKDLNVEALVQLRLLNKFLFIGDLHGQTCGQWESSKTLAIVDFIADEAIVYSDVKAIFLDKRVIRSDALCHKMELTEENYIQIGKKWMEKWQLLTNIDAAAEKIGHVKVGVETMGIKFRHGYSVSGTFEEYINHIKDNVTRLDNILAVM